MRQTRQRSSFEYVDGQRAVKGRNRPIQQEAIFILDAILTLFLRDSQRETERKEEGARRVKLSDVKCDLRTGKTFRALFKKSSFPNAVRQLLLTLSKFQRCRHCCFCHLKIVKQDLAIFSTRRPFKNAFHRFRREPQPQYLVTTANPFTQPVAIFKHLAPFNT